MAASVFCKFCKFVYKSFLVTGNSLITYAKKLKFLTLSPLRIRNRAYPLSLPVHVMNKMIHCKKKLITPPIFYLYATEVRLIKKTGLFAIQVRQRLFFKNWSGDEVWLDRCNICQQVIAYILITPSRRRQLVHISKKTTTELIVRCYCARSSE